MEWNRDDYQGKRKDQVDYSNMVTYYTVLIGIIFGIVVEILHLCNVL